MCFLAPVEIPKLRIHSPFLSDEFSPQDNCKTKPLPKQKLNVKKVHLIWNAKFYLKTKNGEISSEFNIFSLVKA